MRVLLALAHCATFEHCSTGDLSLPLAIFPRSHCSLTPSIQLNRIHFLHTSARPFYVSWKTRPCNIFTLRVVFPALTAERFRTSRGFGDQFIRGCVITKLPRTNATVPPTDQKQQHHQWESYVWGTFFFFCFFFGQKLRCLRVIAT